MTVLLCADVPLRIFTQLEQGARKIRDFQPIYNSLHLRTMQNRPTHITRLRTVTMKDNRKSYVVYQTV